MALSEEHILQIEGVRRLEEDDIAAVEKLTSVITKEYFGDINLPKLIENSFLSLCVYNNNSQIVAAAVFRNTPNVPAIPTWEWLPWIKNIYKLDNLTYRNTLFIHFMAWDSKYKFKFPIHLFTTVFYTFLQVHYIILISPPGSPTLVFIDEYFTTVLPNGYKDSRKIQKLYLTTRQNFVPTTKIRRAVEEDNDDIVRLIGNHTDRLKNLYGDFFISEIIQSQQTEDIDCGKLRQLIVAELNEVAVGVLCLTTDIAYEELNRCFELRPFHGLRKSDANDTNIDVIKSNTDAVITNSSTVINEPKLLQNENVQLSSQLLEVVDTIPITISASEVSDDDDELIILDDEIIPEIKSIPSDNLLNKVKPSDSIEILTDNRHIKYKFTKKFKEEIKLNRHALNDKDIPKYNGSPNAFAIELFASQQEDEKVIAADLIKAAFECYIDRDYCILSIPSTYPPFPLLQNFMRVTPRPYSTFPHELYLLHRNVILSDIEVRNAIPSDITEIENLLNGISKHKQIFTDFSNSIVSQDSSLQSYVLTTEKCIVGTIILREEDTRDYLSSHYVLNKYFDLQQYSIGSFGHIVHAVISPIFQSNKHFFLSEVHRLSDLPIIYFCLYPNEIVANRSLANIFNEMIPIEPRLCPEFHFNKETNSDTSRDFDLNKNPPYALYALNLRYSSIQKMDINRRLVVVGASTTGLAFLENIFFGETASYLSFTNVTLVSAHGLNFTKPPNRARDRFFQFEGRYDYYYLRQIAIQSYVNLVAGVMTAINRRDKYIVIDNQDIIPYDYLYLTCGEQYQVPAHMYHSNNFYEYPENLFIINTEIDADNALTYLTQVIGTSDNYTIIVYGNTLETYCCLSALLEFGIPGTNITFVEPFDDRAETNNISLFNNGDVNNIVRNEINEKNITTYSNYCIKSWKYIADTKRIQSVKFESKFKLLEIECIGIFFYYQKTVSKVTLSAINRAGLVYDSRLVIDPLYQTNDPCIFAAGSMTKYSRRYYADHLSQKYFNHIEVGERLAQYVQRNLDPTFDKLQESPSTIHMREILTPVFSLPVIIYCTILKDINYLIISKPGKPEPISALLQKEDYGRVMKTGNYENLQYDNMGYFRLHLNSNDIIETITCMTKGSIDIQNMIKLYGKHEKLLNNLITRFDSGQINDFFEYFRQPWVYAIFHEFFHDKVEHINKSILYGLMPQCDDSTLINKVVSMFQSNNWEELTKKQRDEIVNFYNTSTYRNKIKNNLLNFLRFRDSLISLYADPLKVKLILAGYEASPLHYPQ